MRELRTNTATRLTVGPFLSNTDGVTPKTTLTVTSEKLTFVVDDAGVPTLVLDTAPTASGGANDMVHITGDDAGFYDLELAAANVNYLGRAMIALTDATTHCPVFHEFMILSANEYDSKYSTAIRAANVTQLLGTAWLTPGTAGTPDVNAKLIGATAQTGRDIGASVLLSSGTGTGQIKISGGYVAPDWGDIANKATLNALPGTTIAVTQKVDVDTIKTNPVVNAGTVTFPTGATLASTTNITAGTIATATAVTTVNGLAAGVITAASIAADAITDAKVASDVTIASVTGAVGSVTGAVGSVTARVTANTDQLAGQTVTAAAGVTFPTSVASPTNITAGTVTTATNVTTVNGLAANVITAASMASDAGSEIAAAVWNEDATGHQTQGTFGQAIGDPVADTNTIYKAVVTDAAGANVAADIVAVKADTAAILVDTGTTLDGKLDVIQDVTDALGDTLEDQGGGVYGFTEDSLQEAPTGGGGGGGIVPDQLSPILLRQFESCTFPVKMLDATTGDDKTGLTLTVYAKKPGQDFGEIAPTVTEKTDGWYDVTLVSGHTNMEGVTILRFTGTGAKPAERLIQVRLWVPGDTPPVNVTNWAGVEAAVSADAEAADKVTLPALVASTTNITAGDVNAKQFAGFTTVALPLVPTVAGRTLDVTANGNAGIDWGNVDNPNSANTLGSTTVATTQKVDVETIKTNPVVNAGTITFPTGATLASTGNITGGIITTVTNLTNAPTSGDLTATMKTSVTTAATAATPAAASVTGSVGSVVGAVGSVTGNVTGSVGSVVGAVGSVTGLTASNVGAIKTVTDRLNALVENSSGDRFTAKALEEAPTASGPTANDIADAVCDELLAGHTVPGSVGAGIASASSAGDPLATLIPGIYTAGQAGYILGTNLDATISSRTKPADTQAAVTLVATTTNLTNAPTSGDLTATMKTSVTTAATAATPVAASVTGNVGGNVTGSVGSVVGAVGSVTGSVASVVGAVGSVTGNVGGNVTGTVGSVVGAVGSVTGLTASDVGSIKAKTDNLPSDPADHSLVIVATDAIFSRLGAPAGASVSADIATRASQASVDDVPTAAENRTEMDSSSTKLANLDATISSRTKPADTQAAVTLVTTVTNLTNAPTSGDLTTTMKTSVTTAATASTPAAASVTGNVGGSVGSVVGSVGSVVGLTASNVGAIKTVTDRVNGLLEDSGGDRFTAKALEAAPEASLDEEGIRNAIGLDDPDLGDQLTAISDKTGLIPAVPASQAKLDTVEGLASGVNGFAAIKTDSAAIKLKTDPLPASPAAVGSAMTLTGAYDAAKTASTQASVDDLPTNAELAASQAAADDAALSAIATALSATLTAISNQNNLAAGAPMTLTAGERSAIAAALVNRTLVESYAADGAAVTITTALYELLTSFEFSIAGTTVTHKKRDGTTVAFTATIDNATTPMSRTRAT